MAAVESQLKPNVGTEARSWSRLKCNLETEISVPWGDRWDCKIVDMSERGFGIITSAKLRKGDVVDVGTPKAKAKVVWARDNRVGLRVAA
ncbi:MAG: PilZ domain-containing protein [Dissulfurispiraceae bacterium]|jgi:hypothetical protein